MISHNGKTYFTRSELACRHCGIAILAPGFADDLLELRLAFGEPMTVNSACRCKAHNDRPAKQGGAGGHPRSLHVCDKPHHPTEGCCAVDIGSRDPGYRARLVKAALNLGWSVGFNAGFIHLDRGAEYGVRPEPQIFLY